MHKNYRRTLIACYMGFITQAITSNFVTLLFLTFYSDYHITMGRLALIPSTFFITQLIVDALCARYVDKIGYRRAILVSQIAAGAGLAGLAFLPELFPDPFVGILLCVVIYAIGSGLIEVLCSPIVEACPLDNKASVMSLLHSFYCWGSVAVIVVSTAFFALFGTENWKWLACFWALIPLANIANFAVCPINHLVEEGKGMSIRDLFKTPLFWLAVLLMICSGASELAMAQWASAFVESALGLSKTVGDLAGPCMFAITMGISRVIYSKWGEKVDLSGYMLGSGVLCFACYLLASMSADPVWGLIGCIACGFSVGIMWPGTISISSAKMPLGGTALFALLAMSGDLGGALGPSIVGFAGQLAGDDLQMGMRTGCIFPILLIVGLLAMKRISRKKSNT